jgi:hypothetical protein
MDRVVQGEISTVPEKHAFLLFLVEQGLKAHVMA